MKIPPNPKSYREKVDVTRWLEGSFQNFLSGNWCRIRRFCVTG
jgi:hypothetical protein